MSNEKELAFRYDLFITPDWRDRFDTLINQSIKLPAEARILDVNCGTGAPLTMPLAWPWTTFTVAVPGCTPGAAAL